MSLKNITIGIDFDDVLSDLNSRAIEMANEEYGFGLELKDISSWGEYRKSICYQKVLQNGRCLQKTVCNRRNKTTFSKD